MNLKRLLYCFVSFYFGTVAILQTRQQSFHSVHQIELIEFFVILGIRIDGATGNVGIGTSSPTAPLEVNGAAMIDGNLSIINNSQIRIEDVLN